MLYAGSYQVFDQAFQFLLGLTNSFFFPYDGNQFLLCVIRRREDDASPRPVPHTADICPTAPNEEFMILWFCLKLSCEVVDLLKGRKEGRGQEKDVYLPSASPTLIVTNFKTLYVHSFRPSLVSVFPIHPSHLPSLQPAAAAVSSPSPPHQRVLW